MPTHVQGDAVHHLLARGGQAPVRRGHLACQDGSQRIVPRGKEALVHELLVQALAARH